MALTTHPPVWIMSLNRLFFFFEVTPNDDDEAIDTHPDKVWSTEHFEDKVGFLLDLVPNMRATMLND